MQDDTASNAEGMPRCAQHYPPYLTSAKSPRSNSGEGAKDFGRDATALMRGGYRADARPLPQRCSG